LLHSNRERKEEEKREGKRLKKKEKLLLWLASRKSLSRPLGTVTHATISVNHGPHTVPALQTSPRASDMLCISIIAAEKLPIFSIEIASTSSQNGQRRRKERER